MTFIFNVSKICLLIALTQYTYAGTYLVVSDQTEAFLRPFMAEIEAADPTAQVTCQRPDKPLPISPQYDSAHIVGVKTARKTARKTDGVYTPVLPELVRKIAVSLYPGAHLGIRWNPTQLILPSDPKVAITHTDIVPSSVVAMMEDVARVGEISHILQQRDPFSVHMSQREKVNIMNYLAVMTRKDRGSGTDWTSELDDDSTAVNAISQALKMMTTPRIGARAEAEAGASVLKTYELERIISAMKDTNTLASKNTITQFSYDIPELRGINTFTLAEVQALHQASQPENLEKFWVLHGIYSRFPGVQTFLSQNGFKDIELKENDGAFFISATKM